MKTFKKITAIVFILSVITLTSCTDNAEENLNERIERENQIHSDVDRGEIDRPGNQGGN